MKKRYFSLIPVALLILVVLIASSCSSSPSTSTAATSPSTTPTTTSTTIPTTTIPTTTSTAEQYTINVATSSTLGQYLVDGKGMTLYWITIDSPGVSNVSGAILANWPVFYTANIVVPTSLKASDFGSITRSDGTTQTTYKGYPLYYFIQDKAPGDTLGQGKLGEWSVINPAASGPQPVSTATTATSTTTTSATTPTTSATTFQTLASAGQAEFTSLTCATCHGSNGQGTSICPVVMWGSGSTLGTYNGVTLFTDAQGMFNYMSKSMPLTAPGSLSHQQYIDLLGYILVQANLVTPSTTFNESQLSNITIK